MNLVDALHSHPFFRKNFVKVKREDFFLYIQHYQKILSTLIEKRIIVLLDEPLYFSAAFFAALTLKIHVVFLPNYQDGSLEDYVSEYDYILNQKPPINLKAEVLDKTKIDFFLDTATPITFFTSGSSGIPKKVSKTLLNLLFEVEELEKQFHHSDKESYFLSTVTHFHIYGLLFRILWPLLTKKIVADFNIEFEEDISFFQNKDGPFVLISSPAFLKRLSPDPSQVKFEGIFSSGGVLDNEVALSIKAKYLKYPNEIFGSTETGGIAFRTQEAKNIKWTPFSSVKLSIGDNDCLYVSSRYIEDGHFLSSDKIIFDENGTFELLGREDRIFKVEEKKISLIELEKKLMNHIAVDDAHCLVLSKGTRDYIGCVIAEAESKDWMSLSRMEKGNLLKAHLRQYFDLTLIPKKFRFLKQLPYNKQSKLPYKMLRKYFED